MGPISFSYPPPPSRECSMKFLEKELSGGLYRSRVCGAVGGATSSSAGACLTVEATLGIRSLPRPRVGGELELGLTHTSFLDGASGITEEAGPRPQVVSSPGSPKVEVVSRGPDKGVFDRPPGLGPFLGQHELVAAEYMRGVLHLSIAKQLYRAPSEELIDQAMKEASHRPRGRTRRIKAALRDAEQRCQSFEQEVEQAQGDVENMKCTRRQLDGEVLKLARDAKALRTKLQSVAAKAIVEYKTSRGFELSMERTRCITYEFGYQVAL
ncbi:hypothetical protein BHM03_00044111 [Ensete ventricosum]|nr:hypothetical protein BHM03_00044111 [Ensete ventricosum]